MTTRRSVRVLACLAGCLAVAVAAPWRAASEAASPPPVSGRGGAVATGDAYATEAGLETLAAGGNAVDAAVAAALALAVTFPEAGNLGGGGFAVVRLGDEVTTLDFRETAPAAARRDMFLDPAGEPLPEASLVGPLAAGVPGSPAGLWALHHRHGKLPWPRVVEPARRLAARGFVVGAHLAAVVAEERELLARFPETAAVWLPGGEPPEAGRRLVLSDLAATLAAYAERGPEAIVAGEAAAAIVAASRRQGGALTAADLAAYEPAWRPPVTFEAFGWKFAAMDLPSSGGVILGETFGLLQRLGWAGYPRFGADRAHLLAEAFRRAFADRYRLGDPATTGATADDLLDPEWLARRAAEISRDRAGDSRRVAPRAARRAAGPDAARTGDGPGSDPATAPATAREPAVDGETTHLSVVDGDGNLVALTTTLNGLFGCGLWVPGAGFFLNNEMDDFATAPGRPNLYGLVQGEANAVGPGKRMLSSMSPTLAWRGGEAVAVGGRGGSRIPTGTAQVLLALLVDGDSLQAALDRPRIHHQWLPDELWAEPDALAPETRAELERRGHVVTSTERAAGKVHAVHRLADGTVEAAVDPRGPGAAGVLEAPAVGRRRVEPPEEEEKEREENR